MKTFIIASLVSFMFFGCSMKPSSDIDIDNVMTIASKSFQAGMYKGAARSLQCFSIGINSNNENFDVYECVTAFIAQDSDVFMSEVLD
jgi:hypothetical protein